MKYILVIWPETLVLTSMDWLSECIKVTDEKLLLEIGPVAFFVPEERFNEFQEILKYEF